MAFWEPLLKTELSFALFFFFFDLFFIKSFENKFKNQQELT